MFQRGYGGLRWSENHQKHAQSTYLDEYLWFKKNLAEKYLLEKVLEHFVKISLYFPLIEQIGPYSDPAW